MEKLYELVMSKRTKPRDAAYCAMLILSSGIGRPKQEVRRRIDEEAAASQRPEIQGPVQRMKDIAQALRDVGMLDQFKDAEVVEVEETAPGGAPASGQEIE